MVSPPRGSDDYVVVRVLIVVVNVSKLGSFVDIAEVMRGLTPRLGFGEVVFTFSNSRTLEVGNAVGLSVVSVGQRGSRIGRNHSAWSKKGSPGTSR